MSSAIQQQSDVAESETRSQSTATEPQSIAERIAAARLPCTLFTLAFGAYFITRSFSDTFFLQPADQPETIPLASAVLKTPAPNQFVALTEFKLDDRKHMRKYTEGHRNRKTYMEICVPLQPARKPSGQLYDCVLSLRLQLNRDGGTRRVQYENARLAKSIYHQSALIGTLHTDANLHHSVFKELELTRGETLVLHYTEPPKNYFLYDSFLAIVCTLGCLASFVSWVCWNPDALSASEPRRFGSEFGAHSS